MTILLPMKIAIIYSLPSERMLKSRYAQTDEDSGIIAHKVSQGLMYKGYQTDIYPISEDKIKKIREIKADCVFNLIEWCGQDIKLAQDAFAMLRKLNLPITGSDEKRFVLTGDKAELKAYLEERKVSTPRGIKLVTGAEEIPPELAYPLIVKPSCEHCSMGLTADSVVNNEQELRTIAKRQIREFNQPALAEEFIKGREFMVYLIEEENRVKILPIEEVIFRREVSDPFQTYAVKWEENSSEYNSTDIVQATLSKAEKIEIEMTAIKGFKELGIWGYARFDMRMRDGKAYILEANANPSVYDGEGELSNINTEIIWGIKFPDYLEKIVRAAIWHFEQGERV